MDLCLFQLSTFIIGMGTFTLIDYFIDKQADCNKYRLQKLERNISFVDVIKLSIFNEIVITLPFIIIFSKIALQSPDEFSKIAYQPEEFSNSLIYIFKLCICVLIEDILFYHIHKLLHI